MKIDFEKYHGAGNDFIMIDNRNGFYTGLNNTQIAWLCDRHLGIGADGLILLSSHARYDFRMRYFNSDGREATMCGNGGRCAIRFARSLGLCREECTFIAADGLHHGRIINDTTIRLSMNPVYSIREYDTDAYFLNTGSPHLVLFRKQIDSMEIIEPARHYRYSKDFAPEGCNVNFAAITGRGILRLRTYERGVEDETLACGTGVTAAALALAHKEKLTRGPVEVIARGGKLMVEFIKTESGYSNIVLIGPATPVFKGNICVS